MVSTTVAHVHLQAHGGLKFDVSGTTCVDWSSFGKCLQWRGASAPIFCIWFHKIMFYFDVTVQEITPSFDVGVFAKYMPGFAVQSVVAVMQHLTWLSMLIVCRCHHTFTTGWLAVF
jgi:hypothetical protein